MLRAPTLRREQKGNRRGDVLTLRTSRNVGLILIFLLFNIQFDYVRSAAEPEGVFSTDNTLKASILQELSKWDDFSDWERVSALRSWAAERIDTTYSPGLYLHDNASFHFFYQNVSTIFYAFYHNWGGVACGGTAWTLMKLYQLFGYESYYLASGRIGMVTHAVTLVYINVDGRRIPSVQDAYFDISYTNEDGHPLDYFEMLRILRNHKHEEIRTVPSFDWKVQRDLILRTNDTLPSWGEVGGTSVPLGDDKRVYRWSFSIAMYENASSASNEVRIFNDFLVREGHPGELLYLYLYPYQVNTYTLDDLNSGSNEVGSINESTILKKAVEIARGEESSDNRSSGFLGLLIGSITILLMFSLLYNRLRKSSKSQGRKWGSLAVSSCRYVFPRGWLAS